MRVALRTPLGLGLDRWLGGAPVERISVPVTDDAEEFRSRLKGRQVGPSLVVDSVHLAGPAVLAELWELLDEEAGTPLVIAGAGEAPLFLLPHLDGEDTIRPVSAAVFQALVPEARGGDHGYAAGIPEAIALDAGNRYPSFALRRFVRELEHVHPNEVHLATVVAATAGIALERMHTLAFDALDVGEMIARLEAWGLVAVDEERVVASCGAVLDALLEGSVRRRRANDVINRSGLTPTPYLSVGAGAVVSDLAASRALRDAERGRDLGEWERLSNQAMQAGAPELRRYALCSGARLALLRGELDTADALLLEVDRLGLPDEDQSRDWTRTLVNVLALRGPELMALPGREELALRYPGGNADVTAGFQRMAEIFSSGWAPRSRTGGSRRGPLEALCEEFAAVMCGSGDVYDPAPYASPLVGIAGPLLEISTLATLGRFREAGVRLTALVGDDWTGGTLTHQLLALQVAAGLDVERTRELLRCTPLPRPGRMAHHFLSVFRARAESVVGQQAAAFEHWKSIWEMLAKLDIYGGMAAMCLDAALVVVPIEGPEALLVDDPRGPLVALMDFLEALSSRDFAGAIVATEALESRPYQYAKALLLLGVLLSNDERNDEALPLLERTRGIFEGLGAPVDSALAAAAIRRIDPSYARPHGKRRDDPAGLTTRDSEVLELVKRGLTNQEIAAQIHLSVGTVKHSVSSLLRHFSVSSRRELIDIGTDEDFDIR